MPDITSSAAQRIEDLAKRSLGGDVEAANRLARQAHDILSNPTLMAELKKYNSQHDPSLPSFALLDERGHPITSDPVAGHPLDTLEISEGSDRQHFYSDGQVGVSDGDRLGPNVLNTVYRDNNLPAYNPNLPTVGK